MGRQASGGRKQEMPRHLRDAIYASARERHEHARMREMLRHAMRYFMPPHLQIATGERQAGIAGEPVYAQLFCRAMPPRLRARHAARHAGVRSCAAMLMTRRYIRR